MKPNACASCGCDLNITPESWDDDGLPICEDCDRARRCDECMETSGDLDEYHLCPDCRDKK